jgi:hypothetical protein
VPLNYIRHYEKSFKTILKAIDFNASKVCFKRLIFQPMPVVLYTWDGWWQDMACSSVGPSSLFQRWNLLIRQNYGLLTTENMPTNTKMRVLLVIRKSSKSDDIKYISRVFANEDEIVSSLSKISGIELVVQDLAAISFEEQVKLLASVRCVHER